MEPESKFNVGYACGLALSHCISISLKVEHYLDLELLYGIKYLIVIRFSLGWGINVHNIVVVKLYDWKTHDCFDPG